MKLTTNRNISLLILTCIYTIFYLITSALIYINWKKSPFSFTSAINEAEQATRFDPTFFEIYDNSTETFCDRLIIVQPFGWSILAINGMVIILTNAGGYSCPPGYTAGVLVTTNTIQFNVSCFHFLNGQLIQTYKQFKMFTVSYDITDSQVVDKFTVLDALNILTRKYIWIEASSRRIATYQKLFTQIQGDDIESRELIAKAFSIQRVNLENYTNSYARAQNNYYKAVKG